MQEGSFNRGCLGCFPLEEGKYKGEALIFLCSLIIMGQVFYRSTSREYRRTLRHEATSPERMLWAKLRREQLQGIRFRRQAGVGNYIVDFYAPFHKLVIEVDGDSHFEEDAIIYDQKRTLFLESLGLSVIRFTNREVVDAMDAVLETIVRKIQKN
jgi:very-short-patch-repair endonuclease